MEVTAVDLFCGAGGFTRGAVDAGVEVLAVDLFCGAGGFTRGAVDAGVEVLAGIDNNEAALRTYNANNDENAGILEDLSHPNIGGNVGVKDFAGVDLVVGSPPCQEFSTAGNRVEDDRAQLTVTFAQLVTRLSARYFVMENVPAAKYSDKWQEGRELLLGAGYRMSEVVLNASHYGVPQKRKRFFAVGSLDAGWNPREVEWKLALAEQEPMTIRDAVGDRWGDAVFIHPRNYKKRGIFSIDEPAPTQRCGIRSMSKSYRRRPNDAPGEPHSLSIADMALLQGFPYGYWWPKVRSTAARQIGNAVPPPLAKAVIDASLYLEEKESLPDRGKKK